MTLKLLDKDSKKLIGRVISREKEVAAELLGSFLDKENRINFDLNGVTVRLGKVKLKLNGNVEVTVILPKR